MTNTTLAEQYNKERKNNFFTKIEQNLFVGCAYIVNHTSQSQEFIASQPIVVNNNYNGIQLLVGVGHCIFFSH